MTAPNLNTGADDRDPAGSAARAGLPTAELVADEQRHLDAALAAVRGWLSRPTDPAAGAADALAAQALTRMHGERRLALQRALRTPFFGMLQDDWGRQLRLGPASIWSGDELLVSSWRVDAAEPFYCAHPDDRRGTRLRRRIQTRDGRVVAVEEERLTEVDAADRFRAAAATAAASPTNGRMTDIVATIQPDQYALISAPAAGALGIQGGPGTGKTAVALHRAAWLLYRDEAVRAGGVLFVGPGQLFLDFVSDVLPALGEEAVDQLVANRVFSPGRVEPDTPQRARLKGDLRIAELLGRALAQRIAPRGPEAIALTVGTLPVEIPQGEVAAALASARRLRVPARAQRIRFLRELASRARPAGGRVRIPVTGLEEALHSHADLRRAAERMWPALSPPQFVADLLASRKRLRTAGTDLFTTAELDALHAPGVRKLKDMVWTQSDLSLLDEARSLILGVPATYAHVIIDEAQDLTPLQLHCLARRAQRGSITLLGDIAQRKSPWGHARWQDIFHAIGQPSARLEGLHVSYRVPAEILQLAAGLLERVAPGLRMPAGARSADQPLIVAKVPEPRLLLALRGVVDQLAARPGQLAIISHESALAPALQAARATCDAASRTNLSAPVVVLTVDEAAGLEFDHVIVFEPGQIMTDGPHGDARLLVALTRAIKGLAVIGSSMPKILRHAATELGPRCTRHAPMSAHSLMQEPALHPPKQPPKTEPKHKPEPKPKTRPPAPTIDWTKASGSGQLGEDWKGWWSGG